MPTFFAVAKSRSLSGDSRHHQLKTVKENNASGAIKARYSYTPKGDLHRVCEGTSAASVTTDSLIRGECDLRDYQYYEHDVFGQLTQTSTYHEPSVTPVTHEVFQYSTNSTQWPDLEQEYTLYKYDAAGRRMQVNGAKLHNLQRVYNEGLEQYTYAWQEAIEPHDTQYRYNGEAIYLSYKTGNSIANPNARWLHGAGVDEPLIRYGNDGSITNYHQNGKNSAVLTTSVNSGAVVASQQFDAFGNVQASSGTITQYGYTGREPDASGLMYYRARYYDPKRGRFIQSDPKGMIDGVNMYAYVRNNPVNGIDPFGTNFNSISSGASVSSVRPPTMSGSDIYVSNRSQGANGIDLSGMGQTSSSLNADTSFITKLGANLPSLPQGVVDFAAGFGDVVSFGGTNAIREFIGVNDAVNQGSRAFNQGTAAGVVNTALIGGAGLINGGRAALNLSTTLTAASLGDSLNNKNGAATAGNIFLLAVPRLLFDNTPAGRVANVIATFPLATTTGLIE